MKRIKILDSCRGLAASIVVFHHVFTRFSYLYPGERRMKIHWLLNFISQLNVEAVLFFFILSGFSIRLSLRKGLPVHKTPLNEYFYRRFKRILPLYLIALCFTFICGLAIHQLFKPDYSLRNLIGNLLFLQAPVSYKGYWFSPYGENGPLWSLSFEMFYYLLFPVLIFFFVKVFKREKFTSNQELIVLAVVFAGSLSCIIMNYYFFFPYIAFGKFFFLWYGGYFLADLHLKGGMRFNINFLALLVSCLMVGGLVMVRSSDSLVELFKGTLILNLFFVLYVLRKGFSGRFIAAFERGMNALFFHLGKGSYALYLLHYPVILVFLSFGNVSIMLIVAVMALLAVVCVRLEEFFVRQKIRMLQLQYIR